MTSSSVGASPRVCRREDTEEVREAVEEVKDQPGIKASVKHGAIVDATSSDGDTRGAGKIMEMSSPGTAGSKTER